MTEQRIPPADGADHDHAHEHPGMQVDGRPPYYAQRIRAIQALLIEKGVLNQDDIQRQIDFIESRSPALGARMVARAWTRRTRSDSWRMRRPRPPSLASMHRG